MEVKTMKIKPRPVKRSLPHAFMPMLAYVAIELLVSFAYVFLVALPRLAEYMTTEGVADSYTMGMVMTEIISSDSVILLLMVNAAVLVYAVRSFVASEGREFDGRYENRITLADVGKMAVMAVGMYFAVNIVMTILMQFVDALGLSMNDLDNTVQGMLSGDMWLTLFAVVIAAPVVEEFLVRGLVFNRFRVTGSPAFAICMSAFVFSAMHFPMIGQCVYTFAVGAVFAWAYYKYENILIPIILHIIYNACSFIFMIEPVAVFFSTLGGVVVFYLLGAVLTTVGVGFIRKKERPSLKAEYMNTAAEGSSDEASGGDMA